MVTVTLYWIVGGLYTVMDITEKPAILVRYKIQANRHVSITIVCFSSKLLLKDF